MHEDDDELPAWCLSEESENEQMAGRRQQEIDIEVQDNLGEHQGHHGQKELQGMHVVPAEMFPASEAGPHDRKQRHSLQQMEKKSKTWVRKTIPFKSVEGVHRCIQFRSANVVKPLISMRKVVQAGNVVVHIRDTWRWQSHQAGCEQRGVHHGHVSVPRRNWSGFQLAGTVSGSSVTKQTCKTKDAVQQENWQYHEKRKTCRSHLIQIRERGVQ